MLIAERPLTSFIWKPDALSWIVGLLASIWVPSEAIGSAIQLVINLSAMAVAGTLTLLVLRARAEQLARRSPAPTQPNEGWPTPG